MGRQASRQVGEREGGGVKENGVTIAGKGGVDMHGGRCVHSNGEVQSMISDENAKARGGRNEGRMDGWIDTRVRNEKTKGAEPRQERTDTTETNGRFA